MEKGGCVYNIINKNHTTLYIGVTSDLLTRINEHKNKNYRKSFSYRYNLEKLIYYEVHTSIEEAIDREKQLKGGSRKQKLDLINKLNPEWKDLYVGILESWFVYLKAAIFYITAYMITIIGAFGLITIISQSDIEASDNNRYQGLFWKKSFYATIFTLLLLSLVGIPLTAGFMGKFFLLKAEVGNAKSIVKKCEW